MKKLLSALLGIFGLFIVPAYAALPSGYTELTYIESTGTQWIDTGFTANGGMIVDAKALPINGSLAIGSNANPLGSSRNILAYANGNYIPQKLTYTTYRLADDGTSPVIIHFDTTNTKFYCKLNETTLVDINNTGTLQDLTTTVKISYSDYERNTYPGRFYYVQIRDKDGILVRNMVPAKNSSNVVGMYDTVNNRFYTNAGSGSFVAGDPVYVCNLFNKNATNTNNGYIGNAYLNQEGTAVTTNSYATSEYINVQPSTTYFWKIGEGTSHSAPRIAYYDANRNYIASSNSIGYSTSFTTPSNCAYVRLPLYKNEIGVAMLTKGDTAPTSYIAYNPSCGCDGTIVNYVSATGTGVQNGTPTPNNPIEPTFYKQGNMVLRKVGDYADTYDASAGKITRRVGVKVLDGTEDWRVYSANAYATNPYFSTSVTDLLVGGNPDTKLFCNMLTSGNIGSSTRYKVQYTGGGFFVQPSNDMLTVENFKSWLAQQYAAGTPVTVWYPLAEETTEDWPASYCETPIKIATTKYNESAFSPLNTALQNAISVVDTVVSNTITQAGRIATLQAQKQTRPNDIADDNEKCPAGKKCLLVEDASGVPHWYEIVESVLQSDYTELEYLRSDGRAYINTNYSPTSKTRIEVVAKVDSGAGNINIVGSGRGTTGDAGTALLVINSLDDNTAEIKFAPTGTWIRSENVNMLEKNRLSLSATKFSVNGDVKETNNKTIPDTDNQPFYIFQRWRPSIASTNSKTQVYEFSIYENDILVRDFVPAKNPDGKVGMYDTVEGRFYENAGTGEFIGGPVAE